MNNGGTAETTFVIEKETSNPKTGDNIIKYISILGLSMISLTIISINLNKKKVN